MARLVRSYLFPATALAVSLAWVPYGVLRCADGPASHQGCAMAAEAGMPMKAPAQSPMQAGHSCCKAGKCFVRTVTDSNGGNRSPLRRRTRCRHSPPGSRHPRPSSCRR